MGLLDRLKGKSGGKLEVVVEPTAAGPGQELTLRLDLRDELDDKAREIRAGITCRGRYEVEERKRNADGDMRTETVWRVLELHEEVHSLQLAEGAQEAVFVLPADAQPVSADCVEWQAWARVDKPGFDIVERVDLDVRVPAERIGARREQDATRDGLTITGVPATVAEGERVTGTLLVELAESVKGTVRIRLHRRRTNVAEGRNDYSIYNGDLVGGLFFGSHKSKIVQDRCVAELDLTDKQEFEAGRQQRLDFAIDVPAAGPTASHRFGQIDWRVEAVIDRKLRDDLAVEAPLVVR